MVSNGSKRCRNTCSKQSKENDFKVLMKLLSVLDYENLIQVSQADIARELICTDNMCNEALNGFLSLE